MKINRKSWHYQLYKKIEGDKVPTSICSYLWTLTFFFVALIALIQIVGLFSNNFIREELPTSYLFMSEIFGTNLFSNFLTQTLLGLSAIGLTIFTGHAVFALLKLCVKVIELIAPYIPRKLASFVGHFILYTYGAAALLMCLQLIGALTVEILRHASLSTYFLFFKTNDNPMEIMFIQLSTFLKITGAGIFTILFFVTLYYIIVFMNYWSNNKCSPVELQD